VDNFTSGNTRYSIQWRAESRQCVQATIADGRIYDIRDIGSHPRFVVDHWAAPFQDGAAFCYGEAIMIASVVLFILTVPPPDWRQPVVQGPGLFCGQSIAYALQAGDAVRIGFPGNPADGTFGYYFFDLSDREISVWERRDASIGEIVDELSLAGSPYTFEVSEYGLISFAVDGHPDVGDVEVALGPDPLRDGGRAAYLSRFVGRPENEQTCLSPAGD
jgi:hypothetical protein